MLTNITILQEKLQLILCAGCIRIFHPNINNKFSEKFNVNFYLEVIADNLLISYNTLMFIQILGDNFTTN